MNPFGGSKAASKIFADEVKPLFDGAGVQLTLHGEESWLGINVNLVDIICC